MEKKAYRIQKKATILQLLPDADVLLYANSFEKALASYGAEQPRQWYSIGAARRYQDKNGWFFDIWREVA